MATLGQTITLWRNQKKLTQDGLARRCGVSRPNLSVIEQGGRDLTIQTLRRIANALGVSAGTLVDGLGPHPEYGSRVMSRQAIDRISRLAAGQRLRATEREKETALALASIMKYKTSKPGSRPKRLRTIRSENEVLSSLKAELGPEILMNLIRRVEKNLASTGNFHE